jgi:hypothetical protein
MAEKKKGATARKSSKATPNRDKTKACAAPRPTRTKAAIAAAQGPAKSYLYSQAIGDEICHRLAAGESLRSICRSEGMPGFATITAWGLDTQHPFAAQFAHARNIGWRHLAEEILEISDDSSRDYVEREGADGEIVRTVDHDHIARARLRVDTRKWLLARMLPKVYGDRVVNEIVGQGDGPVKVDVSSKMADFMAKIDAIANRQRELRAMEEAEAQQERNTDDTNRYR